MEDFVGRMVYSLTNQTYKNLEIILIDDGSTDRSLLVCKELVNDDDRIVVYHQAQKGVSAARNLGLSKAAGEFVLFVDADDKLLLDAVKNMVVHFTDEVDCVIAGFKQVRDGNIFLAFQ